MEALLQVPVPVLIPNFKEPSVLVPIPVSVPVPVPVLIPVSLKNAGYPELNTVDHAKIRSVQSTLRGNVDHAKIRSVG